LGAHHPELQMRYLNAGISGNRVTDLEARWESMYWHRRPDWVSVMVGINDVWRQFDNPLVEQVSLEADCETLETLIQVTLPQVEGMIVMSPSSSWSRTLMSRCVR
jgi:lysophospholipase L1-like esterase